MAGSELPDLWVGNDYKAGIRLHRLAWQAGWHIINEKFLKHIKVATPDLYADVYHCQIMKMIMPSFL